MRSLYLALGAFVLTFVVIALVFRPLYAIVPAFIALGAVFILVTRKHSKAAEALLLASAEELKAQRFDGAIQCLHKARVHAPWVFLLGPNLDGQIGVYLYVQRKFDEARPYLERGHVRLWIAKAMLAADHFRHHKADDAMRELDAAIASSTKEPLLHGLKAWMLWKKKEREKAQLALAAGLKAVPDHSALKSNLTALQNGKDLEMRDFGEAWWQFHLEKPSQEDVARLMGMQGQQRFDRRSMYR